MFEPAFKTLRIFGFLPFVHSTADKNYSVSKKVSFYSYAFYGIHVLIAFWRIHFYIYTADAITYKSFIYNLLVKYEPLINLLYILVIIAPIFRKTGIKKLQKCMNLMAIIKLQKSSTSERKIYYVVILTLLCLSASVEFLSVPIRNVHGVQHFEFITALLVSWMQTLCLMFNCICYRVLLDRIKIIGQELKRVTHKKQMRAIITSFSKCVTFINTFDGLYFFVLKNIGVHCVYDMACAYKGCQTYWERYMKEGTTDKETLADVIASFWNIYNVSFAFWMMNLGQKLQDEVIFITFMFNYNI